MAINYGAIISANQARQQAIAEEKLRRQQQKDQFAKTLGGLLGTALAVVAPELIPALAPLGSTMGVAGMGAAGYAGGALARDSGLSSGEAMSMGTNLLSAGLTQGRQAADRAADMEELAGHERIGMNKAFMGEGYMPTQLDPSQVGPRIGNASGTSLPPGMVSYDPVFGKKDPMFFKKSDAGSMSLSDLGNQLNQASGVASSSGFESDFTVKFGPNITGRFKKPAGGIMGDSTYSQADYRNAMQAYRTGNPVKFGGGYIGPEDMNYMKALYAAYGVPEEELIEMGGQYGQEEIGGIGGFLRNSGNAIPGLLGYQPFATTRPVSPYDLGSGGGMGMRGSVSPTDRLGTRYGF